MQNKTNGRTSALRPAFLSQPLRDSTPSFATPPRAQSSWRPSQSQRAVLRAVEAMPKLTAELAFSIAANPDASVELLPGTPTTIAFTSGGELKGLVVLPLDEKEARRTLGLPTITARDLAADALFEEIREVSPPDELLAEAQLDAWGL